jgi:hypothetical protein
MQIGKQAGICALQQLPLNGYGDALERTDAVTEEMTAGALLRPHPDRRGPCIP